MQSRSRKAFLAVSLAIALIDAVFVYANIRFARSAFLDGIAEEGKAAQAVFEAALDQTLRDMSSLATFIAGDPEVQRLFRDGRDAVLSEGGGAGGVGAATARQALMDKVAPSWRLVQQRFDARQLHFHIGPGSLSFLRVHAPQKFGDRLDAIRHLIVAVDADKHPRAGFETGRVYAGVRGAVPVGIAGADGTVDHLGVLEVGTSMQPLLETIANSHGWAAATLLKADHVDHAMWDDYERALFPAGGGSCGCVVEASTGPEAVPLVQGLRAAGQEPLERASAVVPWQGRMWTVTHFPLRDFLGQEDPARGPVGAVLMWRDATAAVEALNRSHAFNVIYAIVAFLCLELLLFWTFRTVSRHLRTEVAEKTEALARSNRDLEEFVYVASHDLREPLRMVASYLSLIRRRSADRLDERGQEFLSHALRGADRMDGMIRNLLDLSRVSTRGAPLAALSLADVVEEAAGNLQPALREARATLDIRPPLPGVIGDRHQLVRLVQNLLANGLKYQPDGQVPQLTVWGDQDDLGHCRLHVGDNGIGIAPAHHERIFQLFQRLHTQEEFDGSGIGLAICRRIAERHGGTLTVHSTPGQGSVFTLTLPCAEL